jgi:membrane protease YdiL (CAAX protease family)
MLNRIPVNSPYRASDAMENSGHDEPSPNLLVPAVAFEGALAILAVILGWLLGRNPLATLHWSTSDFGLAVAAAVIPLLVFIPCILWPVGPLVDLLRVVEELLIPLFAECRVVDLAIISVLAGIGEEMLFRPIAQRSIAELVGGAAGPWVGLVGAAVLFAAAHWITTTYAVIAGLIGLYLGWLWMFTGNLLVPITTHAVYDFVVLVYLIRFRAVRAEVPTPPV